MIKTIGIDKSSYENIIAKCPCCGHECIFNRASELNTFDPIGGLDVSCLNEMCNKKFRLVGDTINQRHEMLIYDCYELLDRKHYMNCILNLCQAYEVFFSLFLRVKFIYKPFAADQNRNIDDLNRLSKIFSKKINKYTFEPMRSLFLIKIIDQHSPLDLIISEKSIENFPEKPTVPKNSELKLINDPELAKLLMNLKTTKINSLRNSVVHKCAYRPTRIEAEKALVETRSILFPLTKRLELHDDINMYIVSS